METAFIPRKLILLSSILLSLSLIFGSAMSIKHSYVVFIYPWQLYSQPSKGIVSSVIMVSPTEFDIPPETATI
jgi:hypothetical protein